MSHFFALLARMKFIRRWSLMHNTQEENIQEHTLQTAMIAYHLCLLSNLHFGGRTDPKQAAVLALYHDAAEIFTGDMPTPVKYFNEKMRRTYGDVEAMAQEKLVQTLPEELQAHYKPLICSAEEDPAWPFVKAADTLAAYIKARDELRFNNAEFVKVRESFEPKLKQLSEELPEVRYFMEVFLESCTVTVDELTGVDSRD